jgi:MFS family permease
VAGGVWAGTHRRLTTGLVLTIAAVAFEALAVATVLPATVADLGGLAWYGWVFSGLLLTTVLGATLGGLAADRRGAAQPFLAGVALFACGLAIAGLAPSMPVLVGGRVVQGLGAGLVGAIGYVAIGRGYPDRLRPRMLAVQSSAWVVPGLVGPGLAGLVAERVPGGWRLVFLGLIPLLAVAAALALPALRRIEGAGAGAPGGWGELGRSARLAAGVALVLAGLAQPLPLGLVAVAAGLPLAVQAWLGLLPGPGHGGDPATLRAALGAIALVAAAFFAAETFLPLALATVKGASLATGGLVLTAATLTWTAGSWAQARWAGRGQRRALVMAGLGVLAVAGAGVAAVLLPAVPLAAAPLAWGLAGFGMGLAFSTLNLVAIEAADPARPPAASREAASLGSPERSAPPAASRETASLGSPARSAAGRTSALLQVGNTVGTALGTGGGGALIALGERLGWPTARTVGIIDAGTVLVLLAAMAAARRLPRRGGAA